MEDDQCLFSFFCFLHLFFYFDVFLDWQMGSSIDKYISADLKRRCRRIALDYHDIFID